MTPPEDLVRLRHLRDAAQKALHFADGKTRQDLDDDELLRLALTKLVEICEHKGGDSRTLRPDSAPIAPSAG